MRLTLSVRVGQAFGFDGVDDYASMPASSNWAFGTGDFTVEFWEYADGNIYKRPLVSRRSNVQSESGSGQLRSTTRPIGSRYTPVLRSF
ncbi:MAG: hypothetical protein IPI76_05390 [Chloracidobacterium sp.]|nr:hypothetical protein [Chloracidobacterium sp.]